MALGPKYIGEGSDGYISYYVLSKVVHSEGGDYIFLYLRLCSKIAFCKNQRTIMQNAQFGGG